MAGEKSVRLSILGDNSDAKRKIEDIDAEAEKLKESNPELKVGIDTAAASEKLGILKGELKDAQLNVDELGAAGEELKAEFPEISVGVDTLIASAKLEALKRQLKEVATQAKATEADVAAAGDWNPEGATSGLDDDSEDEEVKIRVDVEGADEADTQLAAVNEKLKATEQDAKKVRDAFAEIDAAAATLSAAHPELTDKIDSSVESRKLGILFGELKASNTEAKSLKKSLAEVDAAKLGQGALWAGIFSASVGPLPAILGTVATGVVGVGSALAGGVIGLGVFGVVAKSVFGEYTKQMTATYGAQQRIADGETGKALAADNTLIQKSMSGIPSAAQGMILGANNARLQWHSFVVQSAGGVANVLTPALALVPKLLQEAGKFLPPVEKALEGIISKIGKGLNSSGFDKFINVLVRGAGPSITKVAGIIGHLASMAGKVVEAFAPIGGKVLTVIDGLLGKADSGTNSALQKFLNWVSDKGPTAMGILKNLGGAVVDIAKAFGRSSSINLTLFSALAGLLAGIAAHPIGADALAGLLVLAKIAPMVGSVVKLAEAFKTLSEAEWLAEIASVALDAVPIIAIIAGIILVIILIITHWKQFKAVVIDVWHALTDAASKAWNWIKHNWPLILAVLIGPIALAALFIVKHWSAIEDGAKRMFDNVIGFFKSLPGRILGALGDLGQLLLNAGSALLGGFLNGIVSGFDKVKNVVGGIAGWISSHKGPIEYDAVLLRPHGQAIMGGLVGGLQDGMPGLTAQLARTTGAIASTRVPGGSSAGTSSAPLQVEWVGGQGADQEFITWLKKNIRIRGGNPSLLGR